MEPSEPFHWTRIDPGLHSDRVRLLHHIRFAIRVLRRDVGYTVAVVGTLALALGAATAVFAVLNAMFLRPLPFADVDRLVNLSSVRPGAGGRDEQFVLSEPQVVSWQDAHQTLQSVGGLQPRSATVTGQGDPQMARAAAVTSGLLPTLGTAPARGRFFSREEELSATA